MTRFAYIDALRGYAVLGVITVHVFAAAPITEGILQTLLQQGARGVQLFYVASAFTLAMSWQSRDDGAKPFFIRRLFRIAPMYWMAIPIYLAFLGQTQGWAPASVSISQILADATFAAAIYPFAGPTIVPGGWTVTTEIAFYLLFPFLMGLIRSRAKAIVALLLAILLSIMTLKPANEFLNSFGGDRALNAAFAYYWLPNQIPVFMTGLAAFLFSQSTSPTPRTTSSMLVAALAALVVIPFVRLPSQISYGLAFGIITYCLSKGAGRVLVSSAVCWFGKISFSAYLLHFLVLNCLFLAKDKGIDPFGLGMDGAAVRLLPLFAVVVISTGALSTATYQLIELPMIRLGERVAGLSLKRELNKQASL